MRRFVPIGRSLLLIAALAGIARAADPRPAPLARYFPKRDLIAYVEYDGIDAHAEAWKKTAASRVFNETPAGAMLASVASQMLAAALPPGREALPTPEELAAILDQWTRSGFAFAINRKSDQPSAKPSCIGLVIRGGGRGPLLKTIKKFLAEEGIDENALTTLDKPGGRKLTLVGPAEGPCVAWWVEKDDLAFSILASGYADAMIAALDGREPDAIEHPTRLELARPVEGFEPVTLAFLDTTALPEMPQDAAIFGLDGLKRVDFRWGFQGEALVSISRFVAPAPRRGVLAMFDQPTFDARALPPLPEGVGAFTAVSVDLARVYDQLASLARLADPKGPDLFAEASRLIQGATGRRLREDILSQVGPKLVFADVPTRVFASSNKVEGFIQSLARVPRSSILIELPDRAGFVKDLEAVATWANARFPLPKDPKARPDLPAPLLVRRLKNVEAGYEIAISPTYLPLPAGYRPSIVVGEHYAALGTSPGVAKEALRSDRELAAPVSLALTNLPNHLTALSVVDSRNSALPEILANVPSLIQWWVLSIPRQVASMEFPPRPIPAIDLPINGTTTTTVTSRAVVEVLPPPVALTPNVVKVMPAPGTPDVVEVLPPPAPPGIVKVLPSPGAPEVVKVLPPPSPPDGGVTTPATPVEVPEGPMTPVPVPSPPIEFSIPPFRLGNATVSFNSPFAATPSDVFRLRLDPDEIPTPEEIRPYLFPASHALSADAQGFRITSRESFPSLNPISLAPLAVSAALPAFQEWRVAKQKERLAANLRQVGIGLSNYHDKHDHYPAASTTDMASKPLLSWRVELLPSLGLQDLYDEFHHDEPWDSPHNKTLLDRMPAAFAHPDENPGAGLTFYRGLIGKGAFFDPEVKQGTGIAMFTDGTSNTLSIVEAREAVPWTKPGTEIVVNLIPPPSAALSLLPKLGGHIPGGFQVLLVDGSVRFIRESVNVNILQGLISRDFGEVISSDSF